MKAYELAVKMTHEELVDWLGEDHARELKDQGGDGFLLDPDVVYPATLRYLARVAAGEVDLPTYIERVRQEAIRTIPPEKWANWQDQEQPLRDTVIDTARRIFTALLREQSGGPLALKILKGKGDWRLSNPNVVGI